MMAFDEEGIEITDGCSQDMNGTDGFNYICGPYCISQMSKTRMMRLF